MLGVLSGKCSSKRVTRSRRSVAASVEFVGGGAQTVGMGDPRVEAMSLLEALAPNGATVPMRTLLSLDESTWFLNAVRERLIEFRQCPADCFRFKKFGVTGRITSIPRPASLDTCSPSPATR